MLLSKLANIICRNGTGSEDITITVKAYKDGRLLWKGLAKDLKKFTKYNHGWLVVEVLIDQNDESNPYDYNKGKIITVI